MNVFVLCTGRCGSLTMTRACRHMTNYTVAHESRCNLIGMERFAYPENHIEVDSRLSWLLGRLDKAYGKSAFYVHLLRDRHQTALSYNRHWYQRISLIRAYSHDILMRKKNSFETCLDFWDTVNINIKLFLKDKQKKEQIVLENAEEDFPRFWHAIGAEGDLEAAQREFKIRHHAYRKTVARTLRSTAIKALQTTGLSR